MKNVLIAIPCLLIGGTEYQTLYTVKALIESNYKVTVVCYFEYDEYIIELYKKAGAKVILLSPNKKRPDSILKTAKFLFVNFKKILKKQKYDVVHIQYMAPGSLAFLIFKVLGVKKIIVHVHTPGHIYKNKKIPRLIMKLSNAFVCVSKSSEKSFFDVEGELFNTTLIENGRKHFTIYNCIELPKKIEKNCNQTFTIGVVSRLTYEKGIDILLNAIFELKKKIENYKVVIIGDGYEKEKLVKLTKKLQIEDKIEWKGFIPKENLSNYYSIFDVVVIPSRFEGFGLTAIEAMSYKIPVIASNVDGLKEIIKDGEDGLLFNKEESKILADKILQIYKDQRLKNKLGENAYEKVKQKFSYEVYKNKINELYEIIIKEK
ncbi:glycosyltransferase family 4 protein [Caminibacter mediatlanticus TB-2]|uniref:Glycosyltransferase family 4 protein n=1 Tax=Caminibacter mediatlanticus TB-2 TaxID=391592 RepID=A0ABX5VA88_9BACT|nr:glycosyltransferase family 4 protein [Caminibacter mediatlanticus]QCT93960.1 glycosyltransferase family 4 protein [Caminibacter mediatlanticus TB-2]